ncbi:MAG: uracil-DNA glycosylase [Alphaproteobacteria bacterium]
MANLADKDSLSKLHWLVEAGADEVIADAPVNNFALNAASCAGGESSAKRQSTRIATLGPKPAAGSLAGSLPFKREGATIQSAREIAQACATLVELKAALEAFDGCELKRFAKNTVFADGAPDARIMFIGEAPGRDEDEIGLPFVGRAGKLLDRMLACAGLDRKKVYITNVLNWRPPQNRDPTPEEAALCLPFLHRHIELKSPHALVLLGAVAVRHVLGVSEGIMRVRGNWHVYQSGSAAVPVMPTLHPAYLLRQPSAKRLAWRDMLAVLDRLAR